MPVVCDLPSECIPEAACVEKYGGPGPCPKYCELPADSSSQTLPIPTPSLDPIFLAPRLERHPARDEIFHCGPYPQPDGPTISTECPENLRCICYANSLPRPEGEICKGFCQRPEDVLPPPPNPTPATGTPIPRAIHAKRQNPAYPSSSITYTPSPGPTPDSSLRLEAGINESCEGHITETRCAKGLKCIKEGECIPSGIDDCSGTCEPTDQNDVFKG
ncbi:hypothetical protein P154DRAFT_616864 [Amniculicola lignicola CBS 123094]|uniref:Uncharacterized protein n=1 Tax=Amniculicola lignicola CBS 123094 TaxID=1392246 RepID=A0A6A5WX38_9PLEO|nr:hypothetical protein P154DRAFT_616864 [Amniculicola lignicola CBS 123094]